MYCLLSSLQRILWSSLAHAMVKVTTNLECPHVSYKNKQTARMFLFFKVVRTMLVRVITLQGCENSRHFPDSPTYPCCCFVECAHYYCQCYHYTI